MKTIEQEGPRLLNLGAAILQVLESIHGKGRQRTSFLVNVVRKSRQLMWKKYEMAKNPPQKPLR